MSDPTYQPSDFLKADDICMYLLKNLEIHFQTEADQMDRPSAVAHFKKREALLSVRNMLVSEGERLNDQNPKP